MVTFAYDWRKVQRPPKPDFVEGSLEYVIAVPKDRNFILEFLREEYFSRQELIKALGLPLDLAAERYGQILDTYLLQPYSILGFHNDELVLVSINSIVEFPTNLNRYNPYSWCIKPDYGADLEKTDKKPTLLTIYNLYKSELESGLDQILPECKKLFRGQLDCVKANASNKKIFMEFAEILLKMVIFNGCDYHTATATSQMAQHICEKFGFTTAKDFLPWKFLINGKMVFNCGPNDEARGALMVKKINNNFKNKI